MHANDRQVGGSHYRSKIQHWDYVVANQIPYLEAMVIKYISRWRKKGGHEDLRKAQHFLEKLFETEGVATTNQLDKAEADHRVFQGLRDREEREDRSAGQQVFAGKTAEQGVNQTTSYPYKR